MEYTGRRDNGVNAHPAVAKVGLGGVFDLVRNSVEPARKTLGIIGMGRIGQATHGPPRTLGSSSPALRTPLNSG